jgi:regulator of nucleoside diphosphate kinase
MRFEISADGGTVPMELRMYAEARVGLAIRRAADRLTFVGVRLRPEDAHAPDSPTQCQLEAWIRGLGLVAAKHTDPDSCVAIDRAAALLEQAVLRKLREANRTALHEQELHAESIAGWFIYDRERNSAMRPSNTLITHPDHRRLRSLVDERLESKDEELASVAALRHRLGGAGVVDPSQIPRNVVTMNSQVVLRNLESGDRLTCTLTYPSEARASRRHVSVTRPLGTAMLGKRVGQIIRWRGGARERRLRIQSVPYQPEAAGEMNR